MRWPQHRASRSPSKWCRNRLATTRSQRGGALGRDRCRRAAQSKTSVMSVTTVQPRAGEAAPGVWRDQRLRSSSVSSTFGQRGQARAPHRASGCRRPRRVPAHAAVRASAWASSCPSARARRSASAHRPVDAPQVTARAHGAGVILGQAVQHFGGDDAGHQRLTPSKAPWQLKPAPNDDSHHQPSGASSASAASSTK